MKPLPVVAILLGGMLAGQAEAQIYDTNDVVVQTFAGSGFYGYLDGIGQQTMFYAPSAIVADTSGNLFVWDSDNSRIRKITPAGTVSTFAGGGTSVPPGWGTNINFIPFPSTGSMVIDHSNVLWMNTPNGLVRIGPDSHVSVILLNGAFSQGSFVGMCVDSTNNIYLSNTGNNRIYRYLPNGITELFVGSGNTGAADGNGLFCSFNTPTVLAADAADNIYVWDAYNYLIRKINQNKDVVTIAGSSGSPANLDGAGNNAKFKNLSAMCLNDSGDLILACDYSIRRMTVTTNFTTIAGSFTDWGYTNGAGNLARFGGGLGCCVSHGMIFVADGFNNRIRSISFDPSSQPVLPANLQLSSYPGLQITGTVGRTYQVQTSPDMNQWSTVATLLLSSSPYLWIDRNPVSGNRFYRAFLLP